MNLCAMIFLWVKPMNAATQLLTAPVRRWLLVVLVAILPLTAYSQEKTTLDVWSPERIYFKNFVMNMPKGFFLQPLTSSVPNVEGDIGHLSFYTTWPEFGAIPVEQSLAIMLEPDKRVNRKIYVVIRGILDARPQDRRSYFDYKLHHYLAYQNEISPLIKTRPGLVRLDIVPGLEGLGRTEEYLAERFARQGVNPMNKYYFQGDLFFTRGGDGHIERAIECSARVLGPPPDEWSKWQLPICSHYFYIEDLALRVEVSYIRRFVSEWREIEARITALVKDNVIQRMDPCGAGVDPCHCVIHFQREYSRSWHKRHKSSSYDPNDPRFDPIRQCAPEQQPDQSNSK